MSEYVLTSSMQARSIVKQAQASLVALAKDDFRSALRGLYQGVLEKQRLNDGPVMLVADANVGTPDASIVTHALETAHIGWRRLSLVATGDRRPSAWDSPVAKLAHKAIYSYIHGFPYTRSELRARWASAKNGDLDSIVDAALSAVDSGVPFEYAAELFDCEFLYH